MREVKHEPDCPALRCAVSGETLFGGYECGRLVSEHEGIGHQPQSGPGTCAYCVLRRVRERLNDIANELDSNQEGLCGELCEVIADIDAKLEGE